MTKTNELEAMLIEAMEEMVEVDEDWPNWPAAHTMNIVEVGEKALSKAKAMMEAREREELDPPDIE